MIVKFSERCKIAPILEASQIRSHIVQDSGKFLQLPSGHKNLLGERRRNLT